MEVTRTRHQADRERRAQVGELVRFYLCAALFVGCNKALPGDKAEYVGCWEGVHMALSISADGWMEYYRGIGPNYTWFWAPIREYRDDRLVVGWLFTTELRLDKPPRQEGAFGMTIDGVPLVRKTAESITLMRTSEDPPRWLCESGSFIKVEF